MKLKSPFSIFILAILYGFTIIQGGHGFSFPQEFTNSESNTFELTEKQHSHVYVAHEIVEYGSNSIENFQPVKNPFFSSLLPFTANAVFQNRYLLYEVLSKFLDVGFTGIDIIFPAHYFW